MTQYDQTYYDEHVSRVGHWDVGRPVRRALTIRTLFVPPDATLVDFAIGVVNHFRTWAKMFATVYAYDINPAVVERANAVGLGDRVFQQDVATPFEPRVRGHVATCFYLFEHLTDQQCANVVRNMVKHAPVNMIVLTPSTDVKQYRSDPTHINPKTTRQWSTMIGAIYRSAGWRRLAANGPRWLFGSPLFAQRFESASAVFAYETTKLWDGLT